MNKKYKIWIHWWGKVVGHSFHSKVERDAWLALRLKDGFYDYPEMDTNDEVWYPPQAIMKVEMSD